MIIRMSVYVEVEADSPALGIATALATIGTGVGGPVRVTGVQCMPGDPGLPLMGSGIFPGSVIGSAPGESEQDKLLREMMDLARKTLKEHKRGDDWRESEGDEDT